MMTDSSPLPHIIKSVRNLPSKKQPLPKEFVLHPSCQARLFLLRRDCRLFCITKSIQTQQHKRSSLIPYKLSTNGQDCMKKQAQLQTHLQIEEGKESSLLVKKREW